MIFPTVHMNGTSKKDLLDDLMNAHEKVREAIDALVNAGPNARDYYVQSDAAFIIAKGEHFARLQKLVDVKNDLEVLAENISFQGQRR